MRTTLPLKPRRSSLITFALTALLAAAITACARRASAEPARLASSRQVDPGFYVFGGTLQLGDRGGANAIFREAGTPELPALVPRFGFGISGAFASGLFLGFDFTFDHWSTRNSGLLGVTMGPQAGWVLFTHGRWALAGHGGLAFGSSRLAVHGGPLFEPAPGQGLSIGPGLAPLDHHEFADVVADPHIEAMLQSITLTASTGFSLMYGATGGGLFGGARLGFQAPLAREDWHLNFERHVGSAPNVPNAGASMVLMLGYRFAPEDMKSGPPHPPLRRPPPR
ncbi:MAG: hypothetical protein ABI193_19560 [Minicystis sp.]